MMIECWLLTWFYNSDEEWNWYYINFGCTQKWQKKPRVPKKSGHGSAVSSLSFRRSRNWHNGWVEDGIIPDSRFPIPDSRFPIPNSQLPIPIDNCDTDRDRPCCRSHSQHFSKLRMPILSQTCATRMILHLGCIHKSHLNLIKGVGDYLQKGNLVKLTSCTFSGTGKMPVPQKNSSLVEQAGEPVHKRLIDNGAISQSN